MVQKLGNLYVSLSVVMFREAYLYAEAHAIEMKIVPKLGHPSKSK